VTGESKNVEMVIRFKGNIMRLTIKVVIFLSSVGAQAAGPQIEEPEGLLQRIRTKMVAQLSQLPNYTCHQVVDRWARTARSGSLNYQDQLEFEVAFIGNKELYGRPGESRIEEASVTSIVRTGTIGNGAFGSSAYAIFFGEEAEFTYIGESKKYRQMTFRYDFKVPQEKSHFLLKRNSKQGFVAYEGSFWVNAETLDLVRLELKAEADQIPPHLGVRFATESMHYTKMRIRDTEFLLPVDSEIAAEDELGAYNLNMIRLERCQEFTGQSVVTFGGAVEGGSADRQGPNP
jgi:hypothetical protein